MNKALVEKYAETVLRSGLALQPGQPLLVRSDIASRAFVEIVTEKAYDLGSAFVHVVYADQRLDLARLRKAGPDTLEYVPSFVRTVNRAYVAENWASLSVSCSEDPDAYEGADASRLGRMRKAASRASEEWLAAISSNQMRWNVCLFPTELWTRKVLGSEGDWEARIWDVLMPILRLDGGDPAASWLAHDAELKRRTAFLNSRRFSSFRFVGPGTDLTIGMAPDRIFAGGRCEARDGLQFFPNIPTEEVFCTPDYHLTHGTVRCTRPVQVMGSNVEGAWFRFEKGRVVQFGADRNDAVLGQYLETDERASCLGEIALVGCDSPIYRSGLVFHNILFDENAACHIALGNGYTECMENPPEGRDALLERGCNVSLVHTDFMIGSEQVSVFGVDGTGAETAVIRDGYFVV